MAFLGSPTRSPFESISLIVGVIGILASLFFFLQRYGMISISYQFPDQTLLLFFAGMTLLSGIVLLFSTIGMFGVR